METLERIRSDSTGKEQGKRAYKQKGAVVLRRPYCFLVYLTGKTGFYLFGFIGN